MGKCKLINYLNTIVCILKIQPILVAAKENGCYSGQMKDLPTFSCQLIVSVIDG